MMARRRSQEHFLRRWLGFTDLDQIVALLGFLFIVLAMAFGLANPLFEATDEIRHFRYVRYLQVNRSLPPLNADTSKNLQAHHPPLYYTLVALTSAGIASPLGPDHERKYKYDSIIVPGVGKHVAANSAIATAALMTLSASESRIDEAAIRRGLGRAGLPGRCEILSQAPLIVVDMAHNVASTTALVETLRLLRESRSIGRRRLIFAVSHEKDVAGILRQLLTEFDEVCLTRYILNPRAHDPADIEKVVRQCLAELNLSEPPLIRIAENPTAAWQAVECNVHSDDLIVVAGSAFLITEVKPLILNWQSTK